MSLKKKKKTQKNKYDWAIYKEISKHKMIKILIKSSRKLK